MVQFPSRPLTPPCVRFRTRRFNRISAGTRSSSGFQNILLSAFLAGAMALSLAACGGSASTSTAASSAAASAAPASSAAADSDLRRLSLSAAKRNRRGSVMGKLAKGIYDYRAGNAYSVGYSAVNKYTLIAVKLIKDVKNSLKLRIRKCHEKSLNAER